MLRKLLAAIVLTFLPLTAMAQVKSDHYPRELVLEQCADTATAATVTINGCNAVTFSDAVIAVDTINTCAATGRILRVICDANLVTLNDATGNLQLNSNFTCSGTDILELFCDGTNWIELTRGITVGSGEVNILGSPDVGVEVNLINSVSKTGSTLNLTSLAASDFTVAANIITVDDDSHAHTTTTVSGLVEADIGDLAHTATAITDGLIIEPDLSEDSGTPTDEDVLTYDVTGTNFNWAAQSSLAAGTAAALAANGANCSAGEIPLGVNAAGAAEGCYEPSESDISDLVHLATSITDGLIVEADLNEDSGTPTDADVLTYDTTGANFNWLAQSGIAAGTAAALAANGANCSAGEVPAGVDASGAAESCDATPAIDCTDCTNIPAGSSHTGTVTWAGTSVLESGIAFVFGDGTDAAITHTVDLSGTDVVLAYTSGNLDFNTPISATSFTADPSDTAAMSLQTLTSSATLSIGITESVSGPESIMDFNVMTGGTEENFLNIDGVKETFEFLKPLYILEQADASADVAAYGQIWVNTAVPNELWFTDDAGTDTQLGVAGAGEANTLASPDVASEVDIINSVSKTGTALNLVSLEADDFTVTSNIVTVDVGTTSGIQAWDADLDAIAALTATSGNVMFAAGSAWTSDATPAIVGTDFTGTAAGLTAGNVTTNANLTGDITSVGNASTIATGVIIEPDLNTDNAALDADYLQYDSTGTNFIWRDASEVTSDLSLVIGTNTQAWDAELDTIAALTETNGGVMFVAGGVWTTDTTPAIDCTDCTNIPAAANLTDIGDVTLSTPADGGVLCFTGTASASVDCTVGGDLTATEDAGTWTAAVVDDSHNHIITNIDAFTAAQLQTQTSDVTTFYTEDTVVPDEDGGTGQSTYTQGDLLHASATDTLTKLAVGSAFEVLRTNSAGTLPEWSLPTKSKSITVEDPADGDRLAMWLNESAITVLGVSMASLAGTSVLYNLEYATTIASGTVIHTDTVASSTPEWDVTPSGTAAVPTDQIILLEITTVTSTVSDLVVTIHYRENV